MATHQDLLDAISRVRAATGDRDSWQSGLSGDDIAAACSPFSSPAVLGDVLARIIAGHPNAFLTGKGQGGASPPANLGLAADAIRGAETALAQQNSTAARVDLQVVTAVLNAHTANADGAAQLDRLQRDIEDAVLSRTDLDTPAGARDFQQFLVSKLRDIRTVVDAVGLDATSKASLAAALASLYASVTPPPATAEEEDRPPVAAEPPARDPSAAETADRGSGSLEWPDDGGPSDVGPPDVGLSDLSPADFVDLPSDALAPATAPPLAAPAAPSPIPSPPLTPAPIPPMAPGWPGGLTAPASGGLPTGALLDFPGPDPLPDRPFGRAHDRSQDIGAGESSDTAETLDTARDPDPPGAPDSDAAVAPGDLTTVRLPDGQLVHAPTAEVAAAMTSALAGVAIPEAFLGQGIVVPAPGTPVAAPLDPDGLLPGDIGLLTDRHALALGHDTALLDGRIRPIADVTGPGFLGWLHPPVPTGSDPSTPQAPVPDRAPAQTAPS